MPYLAYDICIIGFEGFMLTFQEINKNVFTGTVSYLKYVRG